MATGILVYIVHMGHTLVLLLLVVVVLLKLLMVMHVACYGRP